MKKVSSIFLITLFNLIVLTTPTYAETKETSSLVETTTTEAGIAAKKLLTNCVEYYSTQVSNVKDGLTTGGWHSVEAIPGGVTGNMVAGIANVTSLFNDDITGAIDGVLGSSDTTFSKSYNTMRNCCNTGIQVLNSTDAQISNAARLSSNTCIAGLTEDVNSAGAVIDTSTGQIVATLDDAGNDVTAELKSKSEELNLTDAIESSAQIATDAAQSGAGSVAQIKATYKNINAGETVYTSVQDSLETYYNDIDEKSKEVCQSYGLPSTASEAKSYMSTGSVTGTTEESSEDSSNTSILIIAIVLLLVFLLIFLLMRRKNRQPVVIAPSGGNSLYDRYSSGM